MIRSFLPSFDSICLGLFCFYDFNLTPTIFVIILSLFLLLLLLLIFTNIVILLLTASTPLLIQIPILNLIVPKLMKKLLDGPRISGCPRMPVRLSLGVISLIPDRTATGTAQACIKVVSLRPSHLVIPRKRPRTKPVEYHIGGEDTAQMEDAPGREKLGCRRKMSARTSDGRDSMLDRGVAGPGMLDSPLSDIECSMDKMT